MPSCLRTAPGSGGVPRVAVSAGPAWGASTPHCASILEHARPGPQLPLGSAARMPSIPSRACAKLDCQSSLQSLSSRKTVAPPSTRCCQRPWGVLASRAQGRAARLLGPCRHARPEPGCGRAAHAARAALLQCLLVPSPQPPRCLALLGTAPRAQQVAPGTYRTFGFGLDGSFLMSSDGLTSWPRPLLT